MRLSISLYLLLFLFLGNNTAHAQKHFTWTDDLRTAYRQATSLRFQAAEKSIEKIASNDPDNLLRLHVENYLDFFKTYIDEDKTSFDLLQKNKDIRLRKIEKEGDKASPYYRFLQADIRLQCALARLKFEQFATAFMETNKAFKLLSENDRLHPGFMPNKKDLGILHAMVGTIPDNYKWAVDWFSSMDGTFEQGRRELEEVIAHSRHSDFVYETEIYIYYAYLLLHLGNDAEEAWRLVRTAKLDPANDPMACFVVANVAMRCDRGDEAIAVLEKRPKGKEFHPFPYLDYLLGLAKLQRLDTDAHVYLQRFVEQFNGRNFIKDAYQKLAWSQLIAGNQPAYHSYMDQCQAKGYTIVGSDQNAQREALQNEIPAVDLLKARLLFDGGRFAKAHDLLKNKSAADYFSKKNQLEHGYRMGRILQKMNRPDEALNFYQRTIENGRHEPWYFACRSALEKGIILEKKGETALAKAAFKECLAMVPQEHKTGLHQQAKAGLRRVGK